jgi:hypothetical protein
MAKNKLKSYSVKLRSAMTNYKILNYQLQYDFCCNFQGLLGKLFFLFPVIMFEVASSAKYGAESNPV